MGYAESGGLGISAKSTQNFAFDSKGTFAAFSSLSRAASSLNYKLSSNQEELYDNDDFFEGAKLAEDDYTRRADPVVVQQARPLGIQPTGGVFNNKNFAN